eukprot:TRINITY_DN17525_c0_g1_i1.p1 TRINITY_DN17525_c0_g1~~TRINITY_DN17525_c0_g1_i1.p1  ORF type:complete len:480 (-),score=45.84 TRINITY_DN17525_c0_g1_i1:13-1452(-)
MDSFALLKSKKTRAIAYIKGFINSFLYDRRRITLIEGKTMLYRRRWVILLIFVAMNLIEYSMAQTFTPLLLIIRSDYNVSSPSLLQTLTLIYYPIEILTFIPWMYFLQFQGLRFSIVLSMLLEITASWVRLIANRHKSFGLLLFGQCLAATGSPALHFSVSKLAVAWFGEKERATVVALVQLPMFILLSTAAILVPRLIKTIPQLSTYLFGQALAQTLVGIIALIFFRGEPPVPPTLAASMRQDKPFVESFKFALSNLSFLLLGSGGGTLMGLFTAFSINLPLVATFLQYQMSTIGSWTLTMLIGAMLGSIVGGVIVDKFRAYKTMLIMGSSVTVVYILFGSYFGPNKPSGYVYPLVFFMGLLSFIPLAATIEGGANMTYPISEEFSAVIIVMFRDVIVVAFGYGISSFFRKTQAVFWTMFIVAAFSMLTFIGFLAVKKDFRRSAFEDTVVRPVNQANFTSGCPSNFSLTLSGGDSSQT